MIILYHLLPTVILESVGFPVRFVQIYFPCVIFGTPLLWFVHGLYVFSETLFITAIAWFPKVVLLLVKLSFYCDIFYLSYLCPL